MKFFIKKPKFKDPTKKIQSGSGSRKSFSIYKQTSNKDGSTKNETVKSKEIDAINKQFADEVITYDIALRNVTKLRNDLYRKNGIDISPDIFNSQNQKILNSYWSTVYEDRDLIDKDAAKNKLQSAINVLGNVSLLSSNKDAIQKQINSQNLKSNKQRVVVSKLNGLLKFLNRDVKLNKKSKTRTKPKYFNEAEMHNVVKSFSHNPEMAALIELAFYSGCRIGEVFALDKDSYKNGILYINSQIDRQGDSRDPKHGSIRKAFLVPEGKSAFEYWIKNKSKLKLGRTAISKSFKAATKKMFKNDIDKQCKFHDLRHSYAILLLAKGINLTLVAQSMGNSVAVAQEYYAGFSLTDETIETISRAFKVG